MFQLITDNHFDELYDLAYSCQNSIKIISPFITNYSLHILYETFEKRNIEYSIITRFHRKDFASKASDIDTLINLAQNGVKLYAVLNLHSKLYLFDEKTAIFGSANFTRGGIMDNVELSIKTSDLVDVQAFNDYYEKLLIKAKKFPITLKQLLAEKEYIENNPIQTINPQEPLYYGAKVNNTIFISEELRKIKVAEDYCPIINDLKKLPKEEIAYILATLPPKLRDVIRLRFNIGLNDNKVHSFREIGELLGLKAKNNRSHPRQALASALCKLHNPIRYRRIKEVSLG